MLVRCIFVDFSRAFDSLSIHKLLKKLTAYETDGQYLLWLSEFLANRSIRVIVNHCLFYEIIQTVVGFHKGGILALFAAFSLLADHINYPTLKLYANDVKI